MNLSFLRIISYSETDIMLFCSGAFYHTREISVLYPSNSDHTSRQLIHRDFFTALLITALFKVALPFNLLNRKQPPCNYQCPLSECPIGG